MSKLNMNIVKEIMNYNQTTALKSIVHYNSDLVDMLFHYQGMLDTLIGVKNGLIPKDSHEAFNALEGLALEFASNFDDLYSDNKELQTCLDMLALMSKLSIYEVYIPYTVDELGAMRNAISDALIQLNKDFKDKQFKTNFEWDEELEDSLEFNLVVQIEESISYMKNKLRLRRAVDNMSNYSQEYKHNLNRKLGLRRFYNYAGEYWYMTLNEKEQEEVDTILQPTLDEYWNAFIMR